MLWVSSVCFDFAIEFELNDRQMQRVEAIMSDDLNAKKTILNCECSIAIQFALT